MGKIELVTVMWIIIVHFFVDAYCQTDDDATNKWHSNKHLSNHVWTYATMTAILWGLYIPAMWYLNFIPSITYELIVVMAAIWMVTFATHQITDYFTSREVHKRFTKKDFRNGSAWIL